MKTIVISPCVFADLGPARLLEESAIRQGIELRLFGLGNSFADWRDILLRYTIPELTRVRDEGWTHVIYVDCRDVLFVGGLAEIEWKYEQLGSPLVLMSADDPVPQQHRPNAGAWMGDVSACLLLWEGLEQKHSGGDPQQWVWAEWPITGVECDTGAKIFQSVDAEWAVAKGRFVNTVTESKPCVLHFRGGYADPVTGRDARMLPVVEALGWR